MKEFPKSKVKTLYTRDIGRNEVRRVEIKGYSIDVFYGVFNPSLEYTFSTASMLENLPDCEGKRVLDVGTGSGILALVAAQRGANEVVAVDVSHRAIENAAYNIRDHELSGVISLHQSDIFSGVTGLYDVILANLPMLAADGEAGVEENYQTFLTNYSKFLAPDGIALITHASFGIKDFEQRFLKNHEHSKEVFLRNGYHWQVFSLTGKEPSREAEFYDNSEDASMSE